MPRHLLRPPRTRSGKRQGRAPSGEVRGPALPTAATPAAKRSPDGAPPPNDTPTPTTAPGWTPSSNGTRTRVSLTGVDKEKGLLALRKLAKRIEEEKGYLDGLYLERRRLFAVLRGVASNVEIAEAAGVTDVMVVKDRRRAAAP